MDTFKLRLPTIEDWEKVWNCLPETRRDLLHWRSIQLEDGTMDHRNFHLADPDPDSDKLSEEYHCIAGGRPVDGLYAIAHNSRKKYQFRPVLEADEDISYFKDGTVIQMGNFLLSGKAIPVPEGCKPFQWPERNSLGGPFLAFSPYNTEGVEPISWIKCGDILMADRPLLDGLTYDQLKEQFMLEGVRLDTPLENVTANFFYDMVMSQPLSFPRHTGEIMANLHQELNWCNYPETPSRNTLFALANRIAIGYSQGVFSDLEETTLKVAKLMTEGLELYYNDRSNYSVISAFSPQTLAKVLPVCHQDEFTDIVSEALSDLSSHNTVDIHGHLTSYGRAVDQLIKAEEKFSKETPSLGDMLHDAEQRAGDVPAQETSRHEHTR